MMCICIDFPGYDAVTAAMAQFHGKLIRAYSQVTPDMQKEFEEEARKLAQEEEDARLRGEIKGKTASVSATRNVLLMSLL